MSQHIKSNKSNKLNKLNKTKKIVLDDYDRDSVEMSKDTIPDIDLLTETIVHILEYILEPEMVVLENTNKDLFDKKVEEKFSDFSLNYYSTFKMLLDKEDRNNNIKKLLDMFSKLNEIKKGNLDIHEETEKFGEQQNEIYVYPKFGGKEKCEEIIKKRAAKLNKNKK